MTTSLLTRDVKKQVITVPFCEASCRSQWALDNITRAEWMRTVRRDDDHYEFGEWCGYCHAFIPASLERTTMGLNATDPMGLNSTTDMGLR